jgi:hypothetical protein
MISIIHGIGHELLSGGDIRSEVKQDQDVSENKVENVLSTSLKTPREV